MESKKINQLATELAPELSDLTIIGDPTTGISKKITLSQMASLFTGTVEEYPNLASFPLVGTADTIYIALNTNIIYRWNTGTSAYVELSPNIVTSLVFNDANGFDGTISLVGSTATLTITTALTTGSVGFIGASGALLEDNANFFWNNSTKRLGINTNAPTTAIDVFGSGIIGRLNGTSTNNAFLGFASAGTNRWSIGNVQSDNRFRIYSETNTSELVSVLQTGEVGIGIANPLTKLHIFGGASALIANLDANTSVAKSISFRSGNSSRINLEVSGTESGSNAGANFFLRAYSDTGTLLNTPITITRSTGNISFVGRIGIGNSSFSQALVLQNGTSEVGILLTDGTNNTYFAHAASNNQYANGSVAGDAVIRSTSGISFSPNNASSTTLRIASTGIATFSNNIIANGIIQAALPSGLPATFELYDTGGGTNLKYWRLESRGTDSSFKYFNISSFNDALNSLAYGMRIRVPAGSITPDQILFPNGNVGIGTNSPQLNLHIFTSGTSFTSSTVTYSSATSRGILLDNSAGTSQSGNAIWFANSGLYSAIASTRENTGDWGTDIRFFVHPPAVSNQYDVTEKMRLSSIGCLRVEGNTMGWTIGQVSGENRIQYNGSSFVLLNTGNGFTAIAASAFNVNSDYRLKEDLKPFNNSLDILNKIKIYDFKWKANNERNYGVIAHELQEVLPYIVYGEKDGMEENGDIRTQGVDYGKIVPILVKGIQELQQQIEELKALINK